MKRLFGNENAARHSPPADEGGWESRMTVARAAGLAQAQANNAAAGFQTIVGSRSFPYVETYVVNFGVAQAVELWVPIAGYAVSFFDSTNLTDIVNVRFATAQGDVAGKPLPFRPGHALGIGDFTWLGLTWAQIVGAVGTLAILPRGVLLDENR